MERVIPSVLILSSRFDLSCDFVTARLSDLSVSYLRLNSEDLPDLEIALDPVNQKLSVRKGSTEFIIDSSSLRSIYFRRPVYLREYGVPFGIEEQHSRVQWAAFMRNLMLFDNCLWMNYPGATYVAEHKAVQLCVASELGFAVPETVIQNVDLVAPRLLDSKDNLILKGLDTVLARKDRIEVFGFTHVIARAEISKKNVSAAPVTLQKVIERKIDIRVTLVIDQVFSVVIKEDGRGISGDWRRRKETVCFEPIMLPPEIENRCRSLLRRFQLNFGAIDLVLQDGTYYFLEINPTGEWAWLVDSPGLPIDTAIAEALKRS